MTSEHDTALLLIRPTDIDILCGRGKSSSNHPGNINFTKTIQSNLQKYLEAPKRMDRSIMIISLVDEFLDSGCRFLKKNKAAVSNSNSNNECWSELDADQCHEKVGHALRDFARKTKRKKSNNNNNLQSSHSSAAIASSMNQQQELDIQQRMQQQEQHNPTNRRSLSLIMANPLDDETVLFAASHTLPESPIVSDNDDSSHSSSIVVPTPQSYCSRNSFRHSVDFETLENRHDLTLEDSLANFKF